MSRSGLIASPHCASAFAKSVVEPAGRKTLGYRTTLPKQITANSPHIVRFEMPGADDPAEADATKVISALLDQPPSSDWTRAFNQLKDQFVVDSALADLRLVGCSISIVASPAILRSITGEVKDLVYRASRVQLRDRIEGRTEPVADSAPATESPIRQWSIIPWAATLSELPA